jgi:hypothetical protein
MADQHEEEVPTVDICKLLGRRLGRAGRAWRNSGRHPQRGR